MTEEAEKRKEETKRRNEERKKNIMIKSFECFADNGLDGTGIRALGERSGFNSALIYKYFIDLDDLIVNSVAYCMVDVGKSVSNKVLEDLDDIQGLVGELPYWLEENHGKKYRFIYQVYTHPKYREHGIRFFEQKGKRYTEYAKVYEEKTGVPSEKTLPIILTVAQACLNYVLFGEEACLKAHFELLKAVGRDYLTRE